MAEWGWDQRTVWDPPRKCALFIGSPIMCPVNENAKWELYPALLFMWKEKGRGPIQSWVL